MRRLVLLAFLLGPVSALAGKPECKAALAKAQEYARHCSALEKLCELGDGPSCEAAPGVCADAERARAVATTACL